MIEARSSPDASANRCCTVATASSPAGWARTSASVRTRSSPDAVGSNVHTPRRPSSWSHTSVRRPSSAAVSTKPKTAPESPAMCRTCSGVLVG